MRKWQRTGSVVDGILTYDGKGDSLQSAKDYGDFELYVDWKIEEKGDSGLYLRGNPQVHIWIPTMLPAAKGEDKGSGSGGRGRIRGSKAKCR